MTRGKGKDAGQRNIYHPLPCNQILIKYLQTNKIQEHNENSLLLNSGTLCPQYVHIISIKIWLYIICSTVE